MAYLGLASLWEAAARTSRYVALLAERPSIMRGGRQAPLGAMPPSRYVEAVASCGEAVAA